MANVNYIYDKFSQEDYLCNRTKPITGGDYVCALCGEVCEWLFCDDYCEKCKNIELDISQNNV